jgi:hypothetical protein
MIAAGLCANAESGVYLNEEQATPLQLRNPDYPELKEFVINKPGSYILTESQMQRSSLWNKRGLAQVSVGDMVNIHCGAVHLDLQGHTLEADYKMEGISLFVTTNLSLAKSFPTDFAPASLDNRFVTVKNGTIDLAHGEKNYSAVSFSHRWHSQNRLTLGRPIGPGRVVLEKIDYERNEYRFEKLKLLANDIAISVEGSHTVIRDCVIESAHKAAIFIAGNNVTIENCEIRLRKPKGKKIDQPRAAIVLRDGSNAIIRNNRIRVDDDADSKDELHCILVRDGAKDVLVEGNTFINIKGEPVTLTEGAQAIVRDNKFEKSWL